MYETTLSALKEEGNERMWFNTYVKLAKVGVVAVCAVATDVVAAVCVTVAYCSTLVHAARPTAPLLPLLKDRRRRKIAPSAVE